jgi:hypothetical protein
VGTSRSPAEFAAKVERFSRQMEQAGKVAVNAGAEAAGHVMYREALRSIRGPKLAGAKWGTSVKKATSPVNPQALAFYKGPVHWFERGTGPHTIVSTKVGGSRRSRGDFDLGEGMFDGRQRGAIKTPHGIRSYANPRGMAARPFFSRATTTARPVVAQVVSRTQLEAPLRAVFR